MSSPVLTIAVRSPAPSTGANPRRSLAAPTPPASAVITARDANGGADTEALRSEPPAATRPCARLPPVRHQASGDPLVVALDATPLLGVPTGVGVFCREALGALSAAGELQVEAFAISWRRRHMLESRAPEGVRTVGRAMPARPLHLAWRHSDLPPVEWFLGRCDVVHGTNFVVPPTRRAASVVTVHDLTTLRFPEMCDAPTLRFPALIRRAVARGAWVHTPSRYVADEVVAELGVDPDRVRAVHHGTPTVGGAGVTGVAGVAGGARARPATRSATGGHDPLRARDRHR